jgi:hypothetical protein
MPEMTHRQTSVGRQLLTICAILGGGLLLCLVTAGLLFICLRGDDGATTVSVKDEEAPDQATYTTSPPLAAKTKAPTTRALIVLRPDEEKKVTEATQRGVEYLKSTQIKSGPDIGSWNSKNGDHVGYTALAGLTLMECKVPANDLTIHYAAKYVRESIKTKIISNETYQVSLAILFLSRLGDKSDYPLIRSLALRLIASQHASGGWSYGSPALTDEQQARLLTMLQQYPNTGASQSGFPLDGSHAGAFHSSYTGPDVADNSNTQFALLALWAARRYDLPLDPVLRLVAKRFRDSQASDGSWKYVNKNVVSEYPTMTAAGLLGIAVGYGLDSDRKSSDLAEDNVLQRGLKRLAQNIGTHDESQGRPAPVELYFLWSVERVAVLYQLPKVDGKDWYRWGLQILLAHQYGDGKWLMNKGHGSSDIVDTCFALLFLQRANLAKDLTDKIQQLAEALGRLQSKE